VYVNSSTGSRNSAGGIALATSSARKAPSLTFARPGWRKYFPIIVNRRYVERGKPAPDIYLLACDKLGTAPGDCFAVEDSPNGILSAHAAGMKVLFVPDMIEPPEDDRRLAYREFPTLVEARVFLVGLTDKSAACSTGSVSRRRRTDPCSRSCVRRRK
jgi:beta-phosphoglucomutase-like phosphatase (HAD superfamily)